MTMRGLTLGEVEADGLRITFDFFPEPRSLLFTFSARKTISFPPLCPLNSTVVESRWINLTSEPEPCKVRTAGVGGAGAPAGGGGGGGGALGSTGGARTGGTGARGEIILEYDIDDTRWSGGVWTFWTVHHFLDEKSPRSVRSF